MGLEVLEGVSYCSYLYHSHKQSHLAKNMLCWKPYVALTLSLPVFDSFVLLYLLLKKKKGKIIFIYLSQSHGKHLLVFASPEITLLKLLQ